MGLTIYLYFLMKLAHIAANLVMDLFQGQGHVEST